MSSTKDKRDDDRTNEPIWVWIALIGISFIVYIGEGQVRIFGMFYVEWIDLHDTTPLMTSWVGFVFSLPNVFLSPIIGFMADRWSMRGIVFASGIIGAGGMLVAAFAVNIGWVIVGYGILYGLSDCFSMSVALALINKYFDRHLALASGIAWCAGSIGGITMPFIVDGLNDAYSSRGTLLIIAGLRLNLSLAGMVLRPVKELHKSKVTKDRVQHKLPSLSESTQKSADKNIQLTNMNDNPAYLNDSIVNKVNTEEFTYQGFMDYAKDSREIDKEIQDIKGDETNNIHDIHLSLEQSTKGTNIDKDVVKHLKNEKLKTDNKGICCCRNAPSWVHCVFNVKFLAFGLFWYCGMTGFYSIIQFMPPYLEEFGFEDQTAMLLGISGGADLAGRLLFAAIGDLPCTNINMAVSINVLLCGSMAVLVIISPTLPVLIVFMMVMGALGASLWGLCGPLVVDAIGPEHAGLGAGIANSLFGVATTIAPLLIGALREATGSYQVVLYFGATAYFISFFSYMILGRRYPKPKCFHSSTYRVTL